MRDLQYTYWKKLEVPRRNKDRHPGPLWTSVNVISVTTWAGGEDREKCQAERKDEQPGGMRHRCGLLLRAPAVYTKWPALIRLAEDTPTRTGGMILQQEAGRKPTH